jgi:ABC-type molybdate transport system substrate-binding protein
MSKVFAVFAVAMLCVMPVGCASQPEQSIQARTKAGGAFAVIPANDDSDLTLYYVDGRVLKGSEALGRMQQDAGIVLWLAGNQFFAMDDVVHAFQAQHTGVNVGLLTLPPGLLLSAIEQGGWTYGGREYPGRPDVYASVNLEHLKKLKQSGWMNTYAIYMHNEMVLMVARGNPKNIRGVADIRRADVRTSMPNPVNEGIMQFYGRKVLDRRGLWDYVSGGMECVACQTTANNWFTTVHHRETPDRIAAGQSDTGFVWVTEAIEAQRSGKPVDAVRLPPQDSMRDEVAYVIGPILGGPHSAAAQLYLDFLDSPASQSAYAKYGFAYATPQELELKPIP